ncbi:MAG: hypothetical protein ABI222_10545, partial [Opitutaceae bacterium]
HRTDPALEAKLDRFFTENPKLAEHYNAMSKEELIRKLMFAKVERAETVVARNRELEQWVKENPGIVVKAVLPAISPEQRHERRHYFCLGP